MKKIKYTPDAADKLRDMKSMITAQYGSKKAKEIVGEITKSIRDLVINEKKVHLLRLCLEYLPIIDTYLFQKIMFFMT